MSDAAEFLAAIRTDQPMPLGPEARLGALDEAEVEARVARFMTAHPAAIARRDHLRAAALLWHDRLDASHRISQGLAGAEGAWLHGMMHRREPDYDNAKYWFAQVDAHHPLLARLGQAAGQLAIDLGPSERRTAYALVDAVQRAQAGTTPREPIIALQAREFASLVEHMLAR